MPTVVALIRGINLARTNRVPMAELREALAELGYRSVRTLLQSGNVVVETDAAPAEVERAVERAIEARFALRVRVLARTAAELAGVVADDPLGGVADDGSRHFVAFLDELPPTNVLEQIAAEDFGPERFAARGREIHIWCPDGMRDSRLMKALSERRLGVTATLRNWNTVTKLHAMAGDG